MLSLSEHVLTSACETLPGKNKNELFKEETMESLLIKRLRNKIERRLVDEISKSQKLFGHAESNECVLLAEVLDFFTVCELEEKVAVEEHLRYLRGQSRE